MSYLQEFQVQINSGDLHRVLQLWEEYCSGDTVDAKELQAILEALKDSDLAVGFGQYVEVVLPLWQQIADPDESMEIIKLVLDLQTSNNETLAETAYQVLQERYGEQDLFNVKIRLIGLRTRDAFKGAIRNYQLLSHLDKGKFVFHSGGWGTGEVLDYSLVREELTAEFENVVGRKDMSFSNAFKYLAPIADDHFLARRFGNPDDLEKEAREHPVRVATMLIRDLGPKTAAEIKEEMFELVIPAEEWTKWWQTTRSRLKKDTRIEMPPSMKHHFRLRDAEMSHEDRFRQEIEKTRTPARKLQLIYNFVRDFSEAVKSSQTRPYLQERLQELAALDDMSLAHRLQIAFLQENLLVPEEEAISVKANIEGLTDFADLIRDIDIIAFKKRLLISIRESRNDWADLFCGLFFVVQQSALKEYIIKELNDKDNRPALEGLLQQLLDAPAKHPNTYVWYFQQIIAKKNLPFGDKDGLCLFFEGLLILLGSLEQNVEYRELIKKIYTIISRKRWEVVRNVIEDTPIEYVQEFLLLVTKCRSLSDHDIKILQALAEVVQPSLGQKKVSEPDSEPLWTTEDGFRRLQEQMHQIGTVDTVENAKEIEAARALGDLRENSEYKFALERRQQLQSLLGTLSEQLKQARIITLDDIRTDVIGPGTTAEIEAKGGDRQAYTLLGPWDADPDHNILSFQSKLALAMSGHKVGETFEFQGTPFTVKSIRYYLD